MLSDESSVNDRLHILLDCLSRDIVKRLACRHYRQVLPNLLGKLTHYADKQSLQVTNDEMLLEIYRPWHYRLLKRALRWRHGWGASLQEVTKVIDKFLAARRAGYKGATKRPDRQIGLKLRARRLWIDKKRAQALMDVSGHLHRTSQSGFRGPAEKEYWGRYVSKTHEYRAWKRNSNWEQHHDSWQQFPRLYQAGYHDSQPWLGRGSR